MIVERDYGTVEFEGKTLQLKQEAYADNRGTDGEVVYRASAADAEGNTYMVTWESYKVDLENGCYVDADGNSKGDYEDEGNACDWDTYTIKF